MTDIKIDLSKTHGIIKPMNCVNNGPISSVRALDNFEDYKALEIPYARNHDASFCSGYGGEHTVDVHRIFRNFDADENNPESYIFEPTDNYITKTFEAGTETFYRLGAAIEHGYKFGVYPPKDFAKWARICEHIIRHYTEGWANGFNYKITYWEIWNEPELEDCWQGTQEQFIEFYCTAAMCVGQASALDKLMYYDARPCNYNGLFDSVYNRRPTYYIFEMFRDLRRLGTYIETEYEKECIYTCAATDGENAGVMLTYYNDTDDSTVKNAHLNFRNVKNGANVVIYMLDEDNERKKVSAFTVGGEHFSVDLDVKLFTTYYISIEKQTI